MMKLLAVCVVSAVGFGLVLGGCSKGEEASAAGSGAGSSKAAPAGGKEKVNGATVIHEPPKDGNIPAGGMVLQPPNPNDPKFKADPRLAGGG
ncbi:MAG: hypothetical protein K1X67_04945 [Fimbriimonadaceae bacterium]|nr:hypothetical protein [Fimbriimonadaceae bacterium]